MSRVTGLALRGPTTQGFRPPASGVAAPRRGSSLFRSRLSLLHPEHRTPGRQRFELIWRAGDAVEVPKNRTPWGTLREFARRGDAPGRQLHKVYALSISAARQDPHPATRAFFTQSAPSRPAMMPFASPSAVNEESCAAAALAARHRQQPHGADHYSATLQGHNQWIRELEPSGNLASSGIVLRSHAPKEGAPLRQAAQLSGLDLLYDPAPSICSASRNISSCSDSTTKRRAGSCSMAASNRISSPHSLFPARTRSLSAQASSGGSAAKRARPQTACPP